MDGSSEDQVVRVLGSIVVGVLAWLSATPRPIMPMPRRRCRMSSAVLTGTKLVTESWPTQQSVQKEDEIDGAAADQVSGCAAEALS
jgi:hypothetical protein